MRNATPSYFLCITNKAIQIFLNFYCMIRPCFLHSFVCFLNVHTFVHKVQTCFCQLVSKQMDICHSLTILQYFRIYICSLFTVSSSYLFIHHLNIYIYIQPMSFFLFVYSTTFPIIPYKLIFLPFVIVFYQLQYCVKKQCVL